MLKKAIEEDALCGVSWIYSEVVVLLCSPQRSVANRGYNAEKSVREEALRTA